MSTPRIVIYGNAGSGKTTMARVIAREFGIAHLSLDDICWADVGVLKPLAERIAALEAFIPRAAGNERFSETRKSVPRPLGSGRRWPLPNGRGTANLSLMTTWGISQLIRDG